jgi:hypothetical protein
MTAARAPTSSRSDHQHVIPTALGTDREDIGNSNTPATCGPAKGPLRHDPPPDSHLHVTLQAPRLLNPNSIATVGAVQFTSVLSARQVQHVLRDRTQTTSGPAWWIKRSTVG